MTNGTYPNEYTRYYANQLLEGQGEGGVDAITGATSSHSSFQRGTSPDFRYPCQG